MPGEEPIEVTVARIDQRTLGIEQSLRDLRDDLEDNYVTQQEFGPIRSVVYGMVGLMLTTILVVILAVALKK